MDRVRQPISRSTKIALGVAVWTLVIATWFALTHSKILPVFALPSPTGVVRSFFTLWTESDLLINVFTSWWRIAQAFLWSAVVAIPLGLMMGAFPWVYHFVNPVVAPMRSMPITAFLPAFIGLFGLDEGMKVGFLVFGMMFYLLAVVVEEVNKVDEALLETGYTLGAKLPDTLWLMFRASFPGVFGSFRILYDIGWTYVILAESLNARKGVGHMIDAAYKVLDFERVYAGIISIGVAAFLFRWLLTVAEDKLFPWRRVAPPSAVVAAAKAGVTDAG